MGDVLYVGVAAIFLVAAWALLVGCEALRRQK
jgi:hypothetical protein